jgi:hypothetical protein
LPSLLFLGYRGIIRQMLPSEVLDKANSKAFRKVTERNKIYPRDMHAYVPVYLAAKLKGDWVGPSIEAFNEGN